MKSQKGLMVLVGGSLLFISLALIPLHIVIILFAPFVIALVAAFCWKFLGSQEVKSARPHTSTDSSSENITPYEYGYQKQIFNSPDQQDRQLEEDTPDAKYEQPQAQYPGF